MSVIKPTNTHVDFSEPPQCSNCNQPLKFGDGAIGFRYHSSGHLVCCESCSHIFMRSFIQDYATLISGDTVFTTPINHHTAERIIEACDNISKSMGEWLQAHKQFSSL